MLKVVAATTPILLAAALAAGAAGVEQTPAAPQPSPSEVTVAGCVARNGDVDVNRGTRTLDIAPGALALTNVRIIGAGRAGVPGTPPQDHDSGTIPNNTIVGNQPAAPDTTAFALTGAKAAGLGSMVGRRVEIVGRFADAIPGSDEQLRGTTGTQRGATPVGGAGTREERADERSAHPSAELRKLEVVSFRGVNGPCE
jgi:hypothetical protein